MAIQKADTPPRPEVDTEPWARMSLNQFAGTPLTRYTIEWGIGVFKRGMSYRRTPEGANKLRRKMLSKMTVRAWRMRRMAESLDKLGSL